MEFVLIFIQAAIAALFLLSGIKKIIQGTFFGIRYKRYWLAQFSSGFERIIAMVQLFSSAVLLVDLLVKPILLLTVVSAVLLSSLLGLAAIIHIKKRAKTSAMINLSLLVLTLFIACNNL